MTTGYKYAAFISYSHKDKTWGERLHRALERYRVPKRIRGMEGRDGPIGPRIFPVFRDRDELPTSADLTEQITTALEASATLIVICSPRSATSRWVNEEILTFKRLGRGNRILALIIDGVPNAADTAAASPADECFPEALRFRLADGRLTSERVEPVAADARPEGDGEENARLKIIAGVLGVGFDQLKQRDLEAKRSRLRRLLTISAAVALALTGLLVASVYFARQAREERNRALRQLGDKYGAQARELLEAGQHDAAMRMALLAIRQSEGTSPLGVEVLRAAGDILRARFSINTHPGARPAFSRGHRLLASPVGNEVLVWDTQTAALKLRLVGASRSLRDVGFSPEADRIVAGSEDGTARVWDVGTGQPVGIIRGVNDEIWYARFWRNGTAIVTGTSRGRIQVWDAVTFQERISLGFEPSVRDREGKPVQSAVGEGLASVDVSSDGRKIALTTRSGQVALFVFDREGYASTTLLETSRSDRAIFSADSKHLLTMDAESLESEAHLGPGEAQLWDAQTGERLSWRADRQTLAAFSADGSRIAAAGGLLGELTITHLASGTVETVADTFSVHGALQFSSDGRLLASAVRGDIHVFELGEQSILRTTLTGHVEGIQSLEFGSDSRTLYSASRDGTIRQWYLGERLEDEIASVPIPGRERISVVIAGSEVFFSEAGTLRSIDTSRREVADERGIGPEAGALELSWRGDRIASGKTKAWTLNTTTREVVRMLPSLAPRRDARIELLAWSRDDRMLAGVMGSESSWRPRDWRGIAIWETQSGRLLRELELSAGPQIVQLAFSADGSRLVLLDLEGLVEVRGIDGTPVFGWKTELRSFSISLSGELIAMADQEARLEIRNLQTGKVVATFQGHRGGPRRRSIVGLSEDGRYLYSYAQDETVRLWDVATRSEVLTWATHGILPSPYFSSEQMCVSFLPGGKYLALHSLTAGDTRIIDIVTGVIAASLPSTLGCPVFTRNLRIAAGPSLAGVSVWKTSRLGMSADQLVAAACDRGRLPLSARTFTKAEADRNPTIKTLRLDSSGREIDACTGLPLK